MPITHSEREARMSQIESLAVRLGGDGGYQKKWDGYALLLDLACIPSRRLDRHR